MTQRLGYAKPGDPDLPRWYQDRAGFSGSLIPTTAAWRVAVALVAIETFPAVMGGLVRTAWQILEGDCRARPTMPRSRNAVAAPSK
jgi:hypothetical protein